MDEPLQLTRYSQPTKMDVAPYMSICRVSTKEGIEIYVQRSSDDMDPKWEYISGDITDKELQDIISKRYG